MKNAFKLILLVCLFCYTNAFAKEVRILHITDTNINSQNAYKLKTTIKEINSLKNIDFVLFGGNNLAKANIENLNILIHVLRKVNKKTVVLLGSTDVFSSNGIDKKYYLQKVRRAKFSHNKNTNYTFKKNGYLFVVMDGTKQYFKANNGYYSKQELLWLEKTLEKNTKKDIIILQHFPLLETSSKWNETYKMEEYNQLLQKYNNVKVIISGHYNQNIELEKDNIYHIVTESYAKTGAYKIIEIDTKNNYIGTFLIKD